MKIAIVGAGIAGNTTARRLFQAGHDITLFEAGDHVGGHTHTHDVEYDGERHAIDTGFIVYNPETYPNLVRLFEHLDVPVAPTTMGFAVSLDGGAYEYAGTTMLGLFGQPSNALRPSHYKMIAEILRFFRAEAPGNS